MTVWQIVSVAGPQNKGSKSRFEKSGNTLWKSQPRGQGSGEEHGQEKACRAGGESGDDLAGAESEPGELQGPEGQVREPNLPQGQQEATHRSP